MILAVITEALVYRATDALAALAPAAGLALAAVFTVAAVTKLSDPTATAREFADLGLPASSLLSRLVPPAELVIAALLLFRPVAGALLATLALLAFTAVLIAVLRTGRSVTCGCLGALSQRPVSATTLVRNGALLGLAALTSAGPTADGLAPVLPTVDVALTTGTVAVLALVGYQIVALRNQIGRLWSVELAGEATGGRRTRRREPNRAHGDRAATNLAHAERATATNGAVS